MKPDLCVLRLEAIAIRLEAIATSSYLLLVVMPFAPSSFLLLVVWPGAPAIRMLRRLSRSPSADFHRLDMSPRCQVDKNTMTDSLNGWSQVVDGGNGQLAFYNERAKKYVSMTGTDCREFYQLPLHCCSHVGIALACLQRSSTSILLCTMQRMYVETM